MHKKGESHSLYYYPRQIFQTCSFMLYSTKSGGVPLKALSCEMDQTESGFILKGLLKVEPRRFSENMAGPPIL
jgi:hypothetical protein